MTDSKNKDSLMKLLLSSGPSSSLGSHGTPTSSVESPLSDQGEDNCPMLSSYLNQINVAGQNASQPWDKVHFDHNYARVGSDSFYHSHVKPTKTLFMTKPPSNLLNSDDVIDVTTEVYYPTPPYDVTKAQQAMEECEKCVNVTESEENEPEDWEESISRLYILVDFSTILSAADIMRTVKENLKNKTRLQNRSMVLFYSPDDDSSRLSCRNVDQTGWTTSQSNLFNKVVKILHSDRLARLANSGDRNEPVLRRLTVDKSAQRFRETLAGVMWDVRLTQWLHSILIENLTASYLAAYLEILQTLKGKIKNLIDKMMANNTQLTNKTSIGAEALNVLLKQPWDPTVSSLTHHKLRKLPGNPILILVPSGVKRQHTTPRMQVWTNHLSSLGTLVNISSSLTHLGTKISTQSYLAQMMTTTKGKLAEVRGEYPRRPIILIGWRAGASLACQVAVTEVVTAVVCLGFSANTVEGPRGEPDDSILDVQCPVLFVTGENAASSRQEDLEEMREKMRVQTGLLVVGSSDDCLRMGKTRKRLEGVTQSMVDRCILEEIGDFLAGVLTTPKPLLSSNDLRRGTFARRRHNSTTSSVDSESSTAKRSRPGTPQSQTTSNATATTKSLVHVNGNLKAGTARLATRGRRPGNIKKSIMMNPSFHSNVNNSNGGITVNIGSFASLGSLGSLRMGASTSGRGETSSNFLSLPQGSSKAQESIIDAAPPEEVMPLSRDSSDGSQNDLKTVTPPGTQNVSKAGTRLIVTPSSTSQNTTTKNSPSPNSRLSVSNAAGTEEKKMHPLRHVITSTPRLTTVTQPSRGGATLQLVDKLQPKISKAMVCRSPTSTTSTTLNSQSTPRPQIRSVSRTPTIIKTSPGPSPKPSSPAGRGQKFSLSQASGKFVTSTGANIILLESSGGQNRPVIVSSSGTKMATQLKATPQKVMKSAQTPKTSPVTKLSMSKKIISTSSILQQRPLLLRNKPQPSTPGLSKVKQEEGNADSSQGDILEIPIYYAEEGKDEAGLRLSERQEELQQPVVIPIIDSSKQKTAKKTYPKDISYTEDGDSISFPLDCDMEGNEEDGMKVLIGSLNKVVKAPQIFVTKTGAKKVKTIIQGKRQNEESREEAQQEQEEHEGEEEEEEEEERGEQVVLDESEGPKYFISYSEDNEEGVLYEIVDNS